MQENSQKNASCIPVCIFLMTFKALNVGQSISFNYFNALWKVCFGYESQRAVFQCCQADLCREWEDVSSDCTICHQNIFIAIWSDAISIERSQKCKITEVFHLTQTLLQPTREHQVKMAKAQVFTHNFPHLASI